VPKKIDPTLLKSLGCALLITLLIVGLIALGVALSPTVEVPPAAAPEIPDTTA
jgi:hypothetical protein